MNIITTPLTPLLEKEGEQTPFIITHFVGAAPTGSDPEDVMRQVMMEIKERYSLTDEIPTEESKIMEDFPFWLAKVKDEKLILCIDAVNQLTGVAEEMHWLPEFIPPHVRLVISTTPGISLDNLRKRNWQELELQPLDESMRRRIADEYLRAYHKTLTPDQAERIATDQKCQSPLFLRTLLEELRVFGIFEEFESHLGNYLASENERDLFHKVLIRMEADHGYETVRDVMRAIWASRFGLSENELLGITGIPRAYLSTFLIGLEYHLMKRSGLYTFFHNYLREGVQERYLQNQDSINEAHAHLARYFADIEASARRRDEEPWQWIESGEKERAIRTLSDIKLFPYLAEAERHYELLGYWTKLEANDALPAAYEVLYEEARHTLPPKEQADFFITLGQFLTRASLYSAAEKPLQEAVRLSEEVYKDNIGSRANAIRELAAAYVHQQKLPDAESAFIQAIDIFTSINNLKELSETESNLAVVYLHKHNYHKAIEVQQEALRKAKEVFGEIHPSIAELLNNLASYYYFIDDYSEAERLFNVVLEIDNKTSGALHPDTLRHKQNFANVLMKKEKFAEALAILEDNLNYFIHALGVNHPLTAASYSSRSEALLNLGRFSDAKEDMLKTIELRTRSYGESNYLTISSYLKLGEIYSQEGRYDEAYFLYSTYYPKQKTLVGISSPLLHTTAQKFLRLLHKLDRKEEIQIINKDIESFRSK